METIQTRLTAIAKLIAIRQSDLLEAIYYPSETFGVDMIVKELNDLITEQNHLINIVYSRSTRK